MAGEPGGNGAATVAPASSVAVLFSGGLDSSVLVAELLRRGSRIQPLYIQSRLAWQAAELQAAERFLRAIDSPRLEPLLILDLPVSDLYGDHWSVTGRGVPEADTPDDAVYLPGRNALLIIKAALWCQLHGVPKLALAVLKSNPFADATAEFFDRLASALVLAVDKPLEIVRPFASHEKREVMQLGVGLPLELTFSCIAPANGLHCGRCNKCAERQAAFGLIGAEDPTEYAAYVPRHS